MMTTQYSSFHFEESLIVATVYKACNGLAPRCFSILLPHFSTITPASLESVLVTVLTSGDFAFNYFDPVSMFKNKLTTLISSDLREVTVGVA